MNLSKKMRKSLELDFELSNVREGGHVSYIQYKKRRDPDLLSKLKTINLGLK